jgi:RHS repeat-associated protein
LGSVATEYGSAVLEYYPYGEEVAATTNDGREKYATYRRDATGLDYAWNRMYAATYGRFLQADPYRASASITNPQSWNRYAYVENDPVNYHDPSGLLMQIPGYCPPDMTHEECQDSGVWPDGPGGGGGGIQIGGGSVPVVPSPFLPVQVWRTDPRKAMRQWDLLIAATIVRAFQNTNTIYPMYLDMLEECITTNAITGALQLQRHYQLKDQLGRALDSGTFTEFNAVVAGAMTSGNATFRANDWDFISAGFQGQYNFYQTFVGRSGMGIGPVPIFVSDHGVTYGTLAVEATRTSIKINGVEKSNSRPCNQSL